MEPSNTRRTKYPIVIYCDLADICDPLLYSYEAGNGIKIEGSGFTKKATVPQFDEAGARLEDVERDVLVQVGSYSYTAPDGQVITVKYIADENGFQPTGDHLPTPPSVPEAIVNSLSQQANTQQQQQPQQQQRAQAFGQQQGRANRQSPQAATNSAFPAPQASHNNNLQSPQASNFVNPLPPYPLDKKQDRFAEFSGGSL